MNPMVRAMPKYGLWVPAGQPLLGRVTVLPKCDLKRWEQARSSRSANHLLWDTWIWAFHEPILVFSLCLIVTIISYMCWSLQQEEVLLLLIWPHTFFWPKEALWRLYSSQLQEGYRTSTESQKKENKIILRIGAPLLQSCPLPGGHSIFPGTTEPKGDLATAPLWKAANFSQESVRRGLCPVGRGKTCASGIIFSTCWFNRIVRSCNSPQCED